MNYYEIVAIKVNPDKDSFKKRIEYSCQIEYPCICPHCGKGMFPTRLYSLIPANTEYDFMSSIFQCSICHEVIFTIHRPYTVDKYQITSIFPAPTNTENFSENIEKLSPDFIEIYKQSSQAESNGLNKICGMGYRKALEFLIKDYLIYRNPSEQNKIIKSQLSQCINNYCNDTKIKTLATACAWLGNDETHYERKHKEYGITELKAFICAAITFIDSELTFDEATKLICNN